MIEITRYIPPDLMARCGFNGNRLARRTLHTYGRKLEVYAGHFMDLRKRRQVNLLLVERDRGPSRGINRKRSDFYLGVIFGLHPGEEGCDCREYDRQASKIATKRNKVVLKDLEVAVKLKLSEFGHKI